jgi:DNA mismatch repair protein MutS2
MVSEMATGILDTLEYGVVREILDGYCGSPLGRGVVAGLEPARTPEAARGMIAQVSEARRFIDEGGVFPLQGARDIVTVIERSLEMNRAVDPDGLALASGLLTCFAGLKDNLSRAKDLIPDLWNGIEEVDPLPDLAADLERTVDSRGRILSSASDTLLAVRRKKEDLKTGVRRKAESYLADSAKARWLQDRTVRLRNDRFVLPVRAECRSRIKGVVHGYSASGSTVFVEPEALVEKQNQLEKLKVRENREVSRILWERTRTLIDFLGRIKAIQNAVAWLDFTRARALYAIEYGLTEPDLTEEPVLELLEARHPLLLKMAFDPDIEDPAARIAKARDRVVPLSLRLGQRFDILVITGPNTGGKTVALKTAGLLALMAASGLHVPAGSGSRIPLYTSVLADIGDEQDIFQSLSTFSSHIKRISHILDRADERSLVLLDELGSGTDPQEGEALGRAILAFLLRKKVKVLVSTHLSKLKEFAFSHDGVENGCMEFNPDTLKPTYKLMVGIPGESNALRIAKRLGVRESVLAEAEEMLSRRTEGHQELMDGISRARMQVEAELEQSSRNAQELERMREALAHTQDEVKRRRRILEEEAETEIDAALRRSRDEALRFVRLLKNVPAPHKETVLRLEAMLNRMTERSPLAQKRQDFIDSLRRGDVVHIPRFRQKCRVLKVRKKDRKIEVEYRNMAVDVPFEEVMRPLDE